MAERPHKSDWPAIAGVVLLLLFVVLGLYVGGYVGLGRTIVLTVADTGNGMTITRLRSFPYPWLAAAYRPAAQVESWIRGEKYGTTGPLNRYDTLSEELPLPEPDGLMQFDDTTGQ